MFPSLPKPSALGFGGWDCNCVAHPRAQWLAGSCSRLAPVSQCTEIYAVATNHCTKEMWAAHHPLWEDHIDTFVFFASNEFWPKRASVLALDALPICTPAQAGWGAGGEKAFWALSLFFFFLQCFVSAHRGTGDVRGKHEA